MEENKRKRSEKESEERSTMKKRKEEKKESEERSTMKKRKEEIATDAEVEEFFAILRRMQVAVKYFGEGWRAAVETEAAAADKEDDDDDKEQEMKTGVAREEEEEVENVNVLDLNAAPEGESQVASA